MNYFQLLADVVVVLHLAYVLFVVMGLAAVFLGYFMGWQWVRNWWFRLTHLAMIGIVVVESLLSITCPLTTLENWLRSRAGGRIDSGSFVGRLAHDLLFIEMPPQMFTIAYCSFGAVVVIAFLLVPPRAQRRTV